MARYEDHSVGYLRVNTINLGGTAITSTAAELNIMDGVTATAGELNILDGATATTGEINILDGVTATTSEINQVDGIGGTALAGMAAGNIVRAGVVNASNGYVFDSGLTSITAAHVALKDSSAGALEAVRVHCDWTNASVTVGMWLFTDTSATGGYTAATTEASVAWMAFGS